MYNIDINISIDDSSVKFISKYNALFLLWGWTEWIFFLQNPEQILLC